MMAVRPVFIPNFDNGPLVFERSFDFPWSSGFAEVQKKKNIVALHSSARRGGLEKILEISTKSEEALGQRLSAFSLKISLDGKTYPLESVYQGTKVFEEAGPFPEIFELTPREAKRAIREKQAGRLVRFELSGEHFPLSPKNGFYDWLYIRALGGHSEWIKDNVEYRAFTDIEFNPAKQVNCQARAFAEYLSLLERGCLEAAVASFEKFAGMLRQI